MTARLTEVHKKLLMVRPREDAPAPDQSDDKSGARLIKLQVGECQFTTILNTLVDESTFFASMFSGDWNNPTTSDGAVFIDSDGQIFRHILAYLRSGRFPLFYDAANHVFDIALYQALLGEAKFFGIPRLQQWIEQHRYEGAVQVHRQSHYFGSGQKLNELLSGTPIDMECKVYFPECTSMGRCITTKYEWNPEACFGESFTPENSVHDGKP
ncbi:hypothetical protein PG997_011874 [Apiospora hydei]|uniref:BTB domain-containing protein n=1 Tax=Apiospora hydei TaxID=1337664 RepID=A0ABR1V1T3_9PEZI